jgi:hypothetical protein
MPANKLIKALSRQAYKYFLAQLNLYNIGYIVRKEKVIGKEHINREREDL